MQGIKLEPARILLANLNPDELRRLARKGRIRVSGKDSRATLVNAITRKLDVDGIADALRRLFPKKGPAPQGVLRLDRVARLTGETTVQVHSRSNPALGVLLLELRPSCLRLRLNSVPLFLDGRWPVIAREAGEVPHKRLYAGFIRPRRLHPAAQTAPSASKPFIIDEGRFGLRAGRLRFEFDRSGPISFGVAFLRFRKPGGRPSYLLTPIA